MAEETKLPNLQSEMSMIDMAYETLKAKKQPLPFQNLVAQINDVKPPATEEYDEQIARLYTNMSLDGRFLNIGENFWGLRGWYPFDQKEEDIELPNLEREPIKKKDDDEDEIDEDDRDEAEEDVYDEIDDVEDEDNAKERKETERDDA